MPYTEQLRACKSECIVWYSCSKHTHASTSYKVIIVSTPAAVLFIWNVKAIALWAQHSAVEMWRAAAELGVSWYRAWIKLGSKEGGVDGWKRREKKEEKKKVWVRVKRLKEKVKEKTVEVTLRLHTPLAYKVYTHFYTDFPVKQSESLCHPGVEWGVMRGGSGGLTWPSPNAARRIGWSCLGRVCCEAS